MAELRHLIDWLQQKNQTTPELGLTDVDKLQLLLNHAQAIHCAVYGEPLFSGPFPHPELLIREGVISPGFNDSSRGPDHTLHPNSALILKIGAFVYGPKTVQQLKTTSPPEEAWRRLELALQIPNLEIKTNTIKSCFPGFKDIFDAYYGLDFDNHTLTSINGNTFTYNSRRMQLTAPHLETLRRIGAATRGHSYYVHQNQDGSLEVTEI